MQSMVVSIKFDQFSIVKMSCMYEVLVPPHRIDDAHSLDIRIDFNEFNKQDINFNCNCQRQAKQKRYIFCETHQISQMNEWIIEWVNNESSHMNVNWRHSTVCFFFLHVNCI